jgi:hypothetical protein
MRTLELDDILKANPQVDPSELAESLDFAHQLKAAGLEPPGYRLASAGESRRVHVPDTRGQRRAVSLRVR